jgi:hypothetical protein
VIEWGLEKKQLEEQLQFRAQHQEQEQLQRGMETGEQQEQQPPRDELASKPADFSILHAHHDGRDDSGFEGTAATTASQTISNVDEQPLPLLSTAVMDVVPTTDDEIVARVALDADAHAHADKGAVGLERQAEALQPAALLQQERQHDMANFASLLRDLTGSSTGLNISGEVCLDDYGEALIRLELRDGYESRTDICITERYNSTALFIPLKNRTGNNYHKVCVRGGGYCALDCCIKAKPFSEQQYNTRREEQRQQIASVQYTHSTRLAYLDNHTQPAIDLARQLQRADLLTQEDVTRVEAGLATLTAHARNNQEIVEPSDYPDTLIVALLDVATPKFVYAEQQTGEGRKGVFFHTATVVQGKPQCTVSELMGAFHSSPNGVEIVHANNHCDLLFFESDACRPSAMMLIQAMIKLIADAKEEGLIHTGRRKAENEEELRDWSEQQVATTNEEFIDQSGERVRTELVEEADAWARLTAEQSEHCPWLEDGSKKLDHMRATVEAPMLSWNHQVHISIRAINVNLQRLELFETDPDPTRSWVLAYQLTDGSFSKGAIPDFLLAIRSMTVHVKNLMNALVRVACAIQAWADNECSVPKDATKASVTSSHLQKLAVKRCERISHTITILADAFVADWTVVCALQEAEMATGGDGDGDSSGSGDDASVLRSQMVTTFATALFLVQEDALHLGEISAPGERSDHVEDTTSFSFSSSSSSSSLEAFVPMKQQEETLASATISSQILTVSPARYYVDMTEEHWILLDQVTEVMQSTEAYWSHLMMRQQTGGSRVMPLLSFARGLFGTQSDPNEGADNILLHVYAIHLDCQHSLSTEQRDTPYEYQEIKKLSDNLGQENILLKFLESLQRQLCRVVSSLGIDAKNESVLNLKRTVPADNDDNIVSVGAMELNYVLTFQYQKDGDATYCRRANMISVLLAMYRYLQGDKLLLAYTNVTSFLNRWSQCTMQERFQLLAGIQSDVTTLDNWRRVVEVRQGMKQLLETAVTLGEVAECMATVVWSEHACYLRMLQITNEKSVQAYRDCCAANNRLSDYWQNNLPEKIKLLECIYERGRDNLGEELEDLLSFMTFGELLPCCRRARELLSVMEELRPCREIAASANTDSAAALLQGPGVQGLDANSVSASHPSRSFVNTGSTRSNAWASASASALSAVVTESVLSEWDAYRSGPPPNMAEALLSLEQRTSKLCQHNPSQKTLLFRAMRYWRYGRENHQYHIFPHVHSLREQGKVYTVENMKGFVKLAEKYQLVFPALLRLYRLNELLTAHIPTLALTCSDEQTHYRRLDPASVLEIRFDETESINALILFRRIYLLLGVDALAQATLALKNYVASCPTNEFTSDHTDMQVRARLLNALFLVLSKPDSYELFEDVVRRTRELGEITLTVCTVIWSTYQCQERYREISRLPEQHAVAKGQLETCYSKCLGVNQDMCDVLLKNDWFASVLDHIYTKDSLISQYGAGSDSSIHFQAMAPLSQVLSWKRDAREYDKTSNVILRQVIEPLTGTSIASSAVTAESSHRVEIEGDIVEEINPDAYAGPVSEDLPESGADTAKHVVQESRKTYRPPSTASAREYQPQRKSHRSSIYDPNTTTTERNLSAAAPAQISKQDARAALQQYPSTIKALTAACGKVQQLSEFYAEFCAFVKTAGKDLAVSGFRRTLLEGWQSRLQVQLSDGKKLLQELRCDDGIFDASSFPRRISVHDVRRLEEFAESVGRKCEALNDAGKEFLSTIQQDPEGDVDFDRDDNDKQVMHGSIIGLYVCVCVCV